MAKIDWKAAKLAAAAWGRMGGIKSASSLTQAERIARAKKAVAAREAKKADRKRER